MNKDPDLLEVSSHGKNKDLVIDEQKKANWPNREDLSFWFWQQGGAIFISFVKITRNEFLFIFILF